MRLENTWQEIRDHSFIQNHSRSFRFTAPCWCFFSSVHLTHFLQGSCQRTGMVIAEAWFCAQWPIFVWIIVRLEDPNMAHYKISNRVSHLLIFFICWYLIEWCHVSKQDVQDLQQKYRESEWALLARYVYTYEEFVIVTEAPQCNRMTATGQDTDNKKIIYKYTNRQCTK